MAKRSTKDLVTYVTRLSEAGVIKKPTWLEALEKYPPPTEHMKRQGKRPPELVYEEDQFVAAYYRTNPAASLEPIDLGSYVPPAARRFAYRQLELMQEHGLSRSEAKQKALKEQREVHGHGGSVGERLMEKIQEEEGKHLDDAMATFKERMKNSNAMDIGTMS